MIRLSKTQFLSGTMTRYSFYHSSRRCGEFNLRNDGDGELSLWDVEMRPEYTGKGYARELIKDAIQEAKRIGCSKLWLLVMRDNKRAIHLYEVTGWKKVWSDTFYNKMIYNLQGEIQ